MPTTAAVDWWARILGLGALVVAGLTAWYTARSANANRRVADETRRLADERQK